MAGRTLLEIIVQTLSEAGLPYHDGTSDAGGTTAILRDAELSIWADNKWNQHYLYIDGGSPTQRQLRVTDFDQGNGDVSFTPTLGAAPNALTYMIMPWTRKEILDEIKNAILFFHDQGVLLRELMSYGLVGQSPLYNAGWDHWTSATSPDGWSKAASGVIGRERSSLNLFAGPQSLSLVTSADYVKLDAPWTRWLEDARNGTIRYYVPVKANNASHARINMYVDGDNYSSYHTGGGDWEVLDSGSIDVPSASALIEPRLYNDSTNKVYFGEGWVEMSGQVVRDYPFPAELMTRISSIKRSEALMLAKFAAANLLESKSRIAPVQMRRQIETDIADLRSEMTKLARSGIGSVAGPVSLPTRMW